MHGLYSVKQVLVIAAIAAGAVTLIAAQQPDPEQTLRDACVARRKKLAEAIALYMADADQSMPLTSYRPWDDKGFCDSTNVTWPQIVQPYHKDYRLLRCPADPHATIGDLMRHPCTEKIVPNAVLPWAVSVRSNAGFNYQYLCPVLADKPIKGSPLRGGPVPTTHSSIAQPSETIMLVDTAGEIDEEGNVHGGGRFVVEPPCTQTSEGGSNLPAREGWPYRSTTNEWYLEIKPGESKTPPFGNAFPWHTAEGPMLARRIVVAYVDGSVRVLDASELMVGCSSPVNGKMTIVDPNHFRWDLK